jgi:hypothetical protein
MKKFYIILLIILAFASCTKEDSRRIPSVSKSYALPSIPSHIVIVIEENHAYNEIIKSASAPYINSLVKSGALFTRSHGIGHPSQPNYLELYSGSNQGITNDNNPPNDPFTTANLGRQLMDYGYSFATYSEDLPSIGYNGDSYLAYRRKHNPAANWMGSGTNQIPASTNQPFSSFPSNFTELPSVIIVVPNQNNDMHDGTIQQGDAWLKTNMDAYVQWSKTHNSLFILTFDEDDGSQNNHIVTIFLGQMVQAGKYAEVIKHYNVLRTIEDIYGLGYAGNAANVLSITDCWK